MSNISLAETSSAQNSASKVFVDDSWMYEESRAPKNKNFQKPILWTTDTATATNARALFDVVAFGDDSKIAPGDHYLIVEKHTPEETIKATGWKLLAAGIGCKVYPVQTSLECLLEHESTSIQEVVLQILEFALPFDDWASRTDSLTLTTREATAVAQEAIALLPESQKSIELATLRKRCNEAPYNWNQLMGTLESEFRFETQKRKRHADKEASKEYHDFKESKHLKKMHLIERGWGDRLRFNEMLQRLELDGKHLRLDTIKTKIAVDFNIDINKEEAIDILFFLALDRGYHPVRSYLNQVAEQHPDIDTTILDNIATRYFGNDSAIANIYMKKTLIGAVARVLEPGCKMDTITILYGKQGTFKSTFWRQLVGNEFFTDSLFDLNHKDELAKLRRFWGLELAEIDYLFGQKAVESFKRFLSAQDDTYRPPYGRENNTVSRTCFFVGTTNKKELLNDPTGDRRYWVLDVLTDRIPCELLDSERDLLWAAAVKLYRQGEKWNLCVEESSLAKSANEDYHSVDPWEDAIANYLLIHRKVTTQEILTEVLKLDLSQNDQQKQRRVISILQRLGCESKTVSRNGKKFRAWVYTPPPEESSIGVTAHSSDVTDVVTPIVTAETQSSQPIQLTVTPVTSNSEDFVKSDEIKSNSGSNTTDVTGITTVTISSDKNQNPCADLVVEGNARVKSGEGTAVLPEVTELPESEWMTEENLQLMAADLESCSDAEMLQTLRGIYNKEALKVAARRISLEKREQIRQWVAKLDAQSTIDTRPA